MSAELIYGILYGFLASGLMGLSDLLSLSPTSWLRESALIVACHMYALGAGIDEGAASLMSSWGPTAAHTLNLMLEQGKVPSELTGVAHILATTDFSAQ